MGMNKPCVSLSCALLVLVFGAVFVESRWWTNSQPRNPVVTSIFVDQNGHGNFRNIQAAINSVPSNSNQWIRIHVKHGTYREKVVIPVDKPFILLEGEGRDQTIVEWSDHSTLDQSATFSSYADNIVVRFISFKNTFNSKSTDTKAPAVAALIQGDKCSFYECGFYGLQDTLWDVSGLHYFKSCFIEGAVDFIFGMGQSIYEDCSISVIAGSLSPPGLAGYITAQGRSGPRDTNGFVFKNCDVFGTGKAYLGRPWRDYSRVLFYQCKFSDVIVPEGWDFWNTKQVEKITYAEVGCTGTGSNMSRRVRWEKKLSPKTVMELIRPTFIDTDGWLEQVPNIL